MRPERARNELPAGLKEPAQRSGAQLTRCAVQKNALCRLFRDGLDQVRQSPRQQAACCNQ